MAKSDNWLRGLQRRTRDTYRKSVAEFERTETKMLVEKWVSGVKESASSKSTDFRSSYEASGLKKPVDAAVRVGSSTISITKDLAKETDESLGIRKSGQAMGARFRGSFVNPAEEYLRKYGVDENAARLGRSAADIYGSARASVKPYFEPESARELLENTKRELTHITACILQISYREAKGWTAEFTKLLTSKLAGALGTASLFGLVGTFGTAATGTAIASLSGAAYTSATLAQIGGVFGGGMFAGGLALTGLGFVVGIVSYRLLSSKAREYESLPEEDKRIVSTCGVLIAAIDERLSNDEISLTGTESTLLLEQSLIPLHDHLQSNSDEICGRLDTQNSVAYRQHVLKDFPNVVIDGFRHYGNIAPVGSEGVIAGVLYALWTNSVVEDIPEARLVLEALRRSSSQLHNATEGELGEYLSDMSPEQLRGVASNVKGIYHELLWVDRYNATHDDTHAELYADTNHAGADVKVLDTLSGEQVSEFQLKATQNAHYIKVHSDQYPDIEVTATSEIAQTSPDIQSSGFSDASLQGNVGGIFNDLSDNSLTDRTVEAAGLGGLLQAGREALVVMKGETDIDTAASRTLNAMAKTAAASGITAYLFS